MLQQVLAYTDALVVYQHLCVFPEWWPVSRPWEGHDHHAHLRVAILRCKKETQNSRDVPLSQSSTFVVQLKAMLDEEWMIRRKESRVQWRQCLVYAC